MKKQILAILCLSLGVASSAQAFGVNNFCQAATVATALGAVAGGLGMAYLRKNKAIKDREFNVLYVGTRTIYGENIESRDNMEMSDCVVYGVLNGAGLGFFTCCGAVALAASLYYAGAAANGALSYLY